MLFYVLFTPVDNCFHVAVSQDTTWQQSAAEHSRVVFILLDVYFAL